MEVGLHNLATQLLKKGHEPTVTSWYSIFKKLKKMKFDLSYEVKVFHRSPFIISIIKLTGIFILRKYLNILISIISIFGISHQHFH